MHAKVLMPVLRCRCCCVVQLGCEPLCLCLSGYGRSKKKKLKLFLSVIQPLRSMVKVKAELSDTVKTDLSEVLGWTRNL